MGNYNIGIDIGSTTCKLAVLQDGKLINKRINAICASPLSTVKNMFKELPIKNTEIESIGVTGSARDLIAKYLHTNHTKSEIISHTYGTLHSIRNVNTIIEIGGQDSKLILLENRVIKDFRMNSVCAAGTGSFLEWQAKRLGLTMEEFDKCALKAKKSINVNGRCSVFIESSIINMQRTGESINNIAYSICMCLAQNYLNELGRNAKLIEPIIFQGGVAKLRAMKKAFESILNCKIIVEEDCQLKGALGIALLAKKEGNTICKNFELKDYKTSILNCNGCDRKCTLTEYTSNDKKDKFIVGGKCGKY